MIDRDTIERFYAQVQISDSNSNCWLWQGRTDGHGYGRFWGRHPLNRDWAAHRLSYIICYNEKLGSKQFVCHKCDNPPCCNPFHLFVGTHADNMRDKLKKGRCYHQRGLTYRGENHKKAKLADADIPEIIEALQAKTISISALAARYAVSRDTIYLIAKRKTWTHLDLPAVDLRRKKNKIEKPKNMRYASKLIVNKVFQIKVLHAQKKYGYRVLAKMFGVSRQSIQAIILGKNWRHVTVD